MFVALLVLSVSGFGQTASEYSIKASYIARFTEFTEWPDKSVEKGTEGAVVLCVIGDATFRDIFERTIAALTIKNKRIEIRYISSVEEIENCQILFVASSESRILKQIIEFTKDKPILTVSDTQGFAKQGVIVNFYQERNRIRFEINPSAIEETGLRVSSLLLNVARIVDPTKGNQ